MKKFFPILIAVLGIAIGVMSTLALQHYIEERHIKTAEYRDWRKLNLILSSVEENYVDSVDRDKVTEAAVTAALASLDPHSIYMPPVELEESESDLMGKFDGIGIQFNVPNDTAIVLEAIPGGPSEKAGLLPGDRIIKVDDKVIAGVRFPQDSMVRRMKGPAGTKVLITVRRDSELISFNITRGKIPTHSVDASFMVDGRTGYIRLSKFSRTTHSEVTSAAVTLAAQGMERLIFDVRGNTGGFLDQALAVSNLFLPKDSLIVYMEGAHRKREEFRADGRGIFQNIALDVLIDENTASSSEIFAGAIQDNKRGRIFGRRSSARVLFRSRCTSVTGPGSESQWPDSTPLPGVASRSLILILMIMKCMSATGLEKW